VSQHTVLPPLLSEHRPAAMLVCLAAAGSSRLWTRCSQTLCSASLRACSPPRIAAGGPSATGRSPTARSRSAASCEGSPRNCLGGSLQDLVPFWVTVGVERMTEPDDLSPRIASPHDSGDVTRFWSAPSMMIRPGAGRFRIRPRGLSSTDDCGGCSSTGPSLSLGMAAPGKHRNIGVDPTERDRVLR